MSKDDELLTIDELAHIWKCKKSYIYRLTSQGRLPYYKVGGLKFKLSEIEEWLKKHQVRAIKSKTAEEILA